MKTEQQVIDRLAWCDGKPDTESDDETPDEAYLRGYADALLFVLSPYQLIGERILPNPDPLKQ